MHPLEKEILHLLKHHQLLKPGETVLAAVSGGPDSMALLHVLAALRKLLEFNLTAAYVNHGLRPAETADEETLFREQAEKLGVAWRIGAANVPFLAKTSKLSIEHAARLARYAFLDKAATACNAAKIALGHTADDQGEELLMRLIRGTGRRGLSGMRLLRDEKFIRPLLKTPKSCLLAYLKDRQIPFAIDSSNQDRQFLRNRVRLDLLPYLAAKFNPNIRQTLLHTADIIHDEEQLLADITTAACRKVFMKTAGTRCNPKRGAARATGPEPLSLKLEKLVEQPRAVQRRVLETACLQMGHCPRYRQLEQIIHICVPDSPGSTVHLEKGLRVSKKNNILTLSYPAGITRQRGQLIDDPPADSFELLIEEPGTYLLENLGTELALECLDNPTSALGSKPGTEYLDLRHCPFPLIVRPVRPGDRFHPLGSPGRKKVSDFLTDRKLTGKKRRQTLVIEAGGEIVALAGLAIDHRCRITEKTIKILKIRRADIHPEHNQPRIE